MQNVHVTVFLVSLKAGGVALNLTEASRVYLMDSWYVLCSLLSLHYDWCVEVRVLMIIYFMCGCVGGILR